MADSASTSVGVALPKLRADGNNFKQWSTQLEHAVTALGPIARSAFTGVKKYTYDSEDSKWYIAPLMAIANAAGKPLSGEALREAVLMNKALRQQNDETRTLRAAAKKNYDDWLAHDARIKNLIL
jgi:hypothetical protein